MFSVKLICTLFMKFACTLLSMNAIYKVCMFSVKFARSL